MGGQYDLSQLSPQQNLLLGTAAGVACKVLNYPLLVFKNTSQQGLPLPLDPRKLYRGLPMACMNLGGTTAVQFGATGAATNVVARLANNGEVDSTCKLMGAFLGGVVSGIPCSLWELTMIQQQRFGGTVLATPPRLVRERGVGILTRGVSVTMGRESLYTMAMLGVTPLIQQTLVDTYHMESSLGLLVGALTGAFFSVTLTHPLDTIKTCMQGDVERKRYHGVVATGQSLVKEYGLAQGLFKGLPWRMALISTTFFLVNRLKQTLAPVMFPVQQRSRDTAAAA